MNSEILDWEIFESVINTGQFRFRSPKSIDPSTNFSVQRGNRDRLILTASSPGILETGFFDEQDREAGTICSPHEGFSITDGKTEVDISQVIPFSECQEIGEGKQRTTVKFWAQSIEYHPQQPEHVYALIEWVENVDTTTYFWPTSLNSRISTIVVKSYEGGQSPLQLRAKTGTFGMGKCLDINVGGYDIHIGPSDRNSTDRPSSPGFIIYDQFVAEDVRRKIRECLSFAFGLPLIYFGYTLLSKKMELVGFKAVTPIFNHEESHTLQALPPAPIGTKMRRGIDPVVFAGIANAIFTQYDNLNFQYTSWIYWHAILSPSHATAGQLGAAIEALEKAYRKQGDPGYQTALMEKEKFTKLKFGCLKAIEDLDVSEPAKSLLINKVAGLNNPPQSVLLDRFFARLSLDMSAAETSAWRRRNDSAHGNQNNDDFTDLLKDIMLLKNTFHRVLLAMTKASTQYIDGYTPKFPIRRLKESVDAPSCVYFEG